MQATHAEHGFVDAPLPRSWATPWLCALPCSCSAALLVRNCPARAPEARCVVNAPVDRIEMPHPPARCTVTHQIRIRAPIPTPICGFAQPSPTHTCKPARAAFSTPGFPQLRGPIPGFPTAPLPIPGFPAEMAVIGQEYDGKLESTEEAPRPLTHRRAARPAKTDRGSTTGSHAEDQPPVNTEVAARLIRAATSSRQRRLS